MSRTAAIDKYRSVLFEREGDITLSDREQVQLKRYKAAFSLSLENPWLKDVELRDYLINEFEISEAQAYRDLTTIRILLGNVRNAGKEWARYVVIEGLKEQYQAAKNAGKIKEAIMALDKLGKYTMLDKEDAQELPYEKVIPVDWEATTDVSVLGVEPMKDKEKTMEKLYKKYIEEIEIQDIEYQDATEQGKKEDLLQ